MSADRLTEKRTDNPYYVALVRIDQKDLDELPQVRLYPGMPATVMIQTVERTAVDYLVGPLAHVIQPGVPTEIGSGQHRDVPIAQATVPDRIDV